MLGTVRNHVSDYDYPEAIAEIKQYGALGVSICVIFGRIKLPSQNQS